MPPLPIVGPSYNLNSRPASVQRTINMMPVPLEPGNERTAWVMKDTPGLASFLQNAGLTTYTTYSLIAQKGDVDGAIINSQYASMVTLGANQATVRVTGGGFGDSTHLATYSAGLPTLTFVPTTLTQSASASRSAVESWYPADPNLTIGPPYYPVNFSGGFRGLWRADGTNLFAWTGDYRLFVVSNVGAQVGTELCATLIGGGQYLSSAAICADNTHVLYFWNSTGGVHVGGSPPDSWGIATWTGSTWTSLSTGTIPGGLQSGFQVSQAGFGPIAPNYTLPAAMMLEADLTHLWVIPTGLTPQVYLVGSGTITLLNQFASIPGSVFDSSINPINSIYAANGICAILTQSGPGNPGTYTDKFGLTVLSRPGGVIGSPGGNVRGIYTHQGNLHAVIDATLYRIDSTGVPTALGALNSTAGPVDFASNVTQLSVGDGSFLYVWNGTAFQVVSNYSGGNRIAAISQRLIFDHRATQQFGWSALADAYSIDPLSFASAEGSPDNLLAVAVTHLEAWLFGEFTTEIWDSVGGLTVFQRSRAGFIQYGTVAPFSVVATANSITWLARDEHGHAVVLSAVGYVPQRISTRAIEERFEGIDLSGARAFTYTLGGQAFYCLNVPNVSTTLVWDFAFQQWHERAEVELNGSWQPWRAVCHAFAYGQHYIGGSDGVLYRLDPALNMYGSDPKVRARICPVVSDPGRRLVRFPELELICEKATAATISIRWSNDNGESFGPWHYISTGDTGRYGRRAVLRRMGAARDRVYEIRMSDNAPFNPVAANLLAM
jgi:hypothetical protein